MTKAQALYDFFSSFGITAYPVTSVPDTVTFPYLTYEGTTSNYDDGDVGIAVNLWYNTTSESTPNAKADEIAKKIGRGGTQVACDDGVIWIKRGTPWSLALSDETNTALKRRQLNVTLSFFTT